MAQKNPAASLTYYAGNDFAIIMHGQVSILGVDHTDFAALEGLHRELNGGRSLVDWGGGGRLLTHAAGGGVHLCALSRAIS